MGWMHLVPRRYLLMSSTLPRCLLYEVSACMFVSGRYTFVLPRDDTWDTSNPIGGWMCALFLCSLRPSQANVFLQFLVRRPPSIISGGRRPAATQPQQQQQQQQQQRQHACRTTHANATNQLLEAVDAAPFHLPSCQCQCHDACLACLQPAAARGESGDRPQK